MRPALENSAKSVPAYVFRMNSTPTTCPAMKSDLSHTEVLGLVPCYPKRIIVIAEGFVQSMTVPGLPGSVAQHSTAVPHQPQSPRRSAYAVRFYV